MPKLPKGVTMNTVDLNPKAKADLVKAVMEKLAQKNPEVDKAQTYDESFVELALARITPVVNPEQKADAPDDASEESIEADKTISVPEYLGGIYQAEQDSGSFPNIDMQILTANLTLSLASLHKRSYRVGDANEDDASEWNLGVGVGAAAAAKGAPPMIRTGAGKCGIPFTGRIVEESIAMGLNRSMTLPLKSDCAQAPKFCIDGSHSLNKHKSNLNLAWTVKPVPAEQKPDQQRPKPKKKAAGKLEVANEKRKRAAKVKAEQKRKQKLKFSPAARTWDLAMQLHPRIIYSEGS